VTLDAPGTPTGLACPTTAQCTIIDGQGRETSFIPTAVGRPTPSVAASGIGLSTIDCPSVHQCTAAGTSASAGAQSVGVTFDPTALATSPLIPLAGDYGTLPISCPSTTECVVLSGGTSAAAFNPTAPTSVSTTPQSFARASGYSLNAFACPTAAQCTAVGRGTAAGGVAVGGEVTFAPTSPSDGTPSVIAGTQDLVGVSCPSTTQCTAIDQSGVEVTFDPLSPRKASRTTLEARAPTAIACPTVTRCVVVDGLGRVLTGDPQSRGKWTVNESLGANAFVAVACPSLDECVAVDAVGDAYIGTDAAPKVGRAAGGRSGADIPVSCTGPAKTACALRLTVSVNERIVGHRIVAIGAATAHAKRGAVKTVIIARAKASIPTGTSRIVRLTWNDAGRRLLRSHRHLQALLTVAQQVGAANVARSIQLLTL
jgi:hypothetical protein